MIQAVLVLIGHSWGGAEALLAAARRPASVRSLILVEPALQALLFGSQRLRSDLEAAAAARSSQSSSSRPPRRGSTLWDSRDIWASNEATTEAASVSAYQVQTKFDRLMKMLEEIAIDSGLPNVFLAALAIGIAALVVLLLQIMLGAS